jgi:hypothetical protein
LLAAAFAEGDDASAAISGSDSIHGSASATPAPRKKLRRDFI